MRATTIVDTLIRTAPTAGRQGDAGPGERAGGERDGDDVVAGGPGQVLDHLAVAGPRQPDDAGDRRAGRDEARTTPADSMATSVPAPIAMPTSARASAGASLTPSPTIATGSPRRLQLGDLRGPCPRAAPRRTPRRCRARRPTASATWRASPVIITTSTPSRVQLGDGLAGLGPDLVLERERADDLVAADEVEHGGAAAAAIRRSASRELVGIVERRARAAAPGRRRRSASPSIVGFDAPAGDRPEVRWPRGRRRGRAAAADDRPGQRVLAVGLDGRRRAAAPRRRRRRRSPATPVTACSPLVSVPVLSNSTASIVRIRSRASRSLTRIPACADTRRRQRDHQRDGQAEGVRAGDHQHGHRAHDGLVDVAEQPTRRRT